MADETLPEEGICWICKLTQPLVEDGLCETCLRKLEKEKETGRCSWCGRLCLECVCDDTFGE